MPSATYASPSSDGKAQRMYDLRNSLSAELDEQQPEPRAPHGQGFAKSLAIMLAIYAIAALLIL